MPIVTTFIALIFQMLFAFVEMDSLQTVEPDSLNSSFVMGMEDLIWQSGWDYASMERMSVMLNTNEHGYYGPKPAFILDGIPFEPGFFGVHYTQLFPLSLFRIENQESFGGSGILEGVPYQTGIMKLQSEPVPKGFSIFGSGQLGHNSGEPGPWIFDPDKVTPNVERFGPWLDAGLSVRFGGWYAKGHLRHHDYLNFDEFIQTRIINLRGVPDENTWLRVDAVSTLGLVETGFMSHRTEIRLQGTRSESTDFLFFQPMGREIPTGFETEQYSALARIKTSENSGIRGFYQQRNMATTFRRNFFDYDIGWEKRLRTWRGSFYIDGDRIGIEAGMENEVSDVTGRQTAFDRVTIPSFFMQNRFNIHSNLILATDHIIRLFDDNRSFSSNSSIDILPVNRWRVQISGGYSELMPEQTNPLETWINQGYDLFSHLTITAVLPDVIENNRLFHLAFINKIKLHDHWDLEIDFQYLRHLSIQIPFQRVLYDLPFSTQPGLFRLHTGQTGERLAATFSVHHQTPNRIRQTAHLTYRSTIDGDAVYQQYWEMTPEIRIQYTVLYSPSPDLELQLDVQYLSERTWPEFSRLDGEENRSFHVQFPFKYFTYSNTLPQHLRIDIRVSKWLWHQRLRIALQLKNLLNNDYQTHPIGVREGFGYMSRLEIRF
jgi:hypothetical protein